MRFIAMLACLPLMACGSVSWGSSHGDAVAGSGSDTSRSYAVSDFTGVSLRGADDVDVKVGPVFSVRAEGDKEALDRLEISKKGDTLYVGTKSGHGFSWGSHKGAKIYVTMPRITDAGLAGSGNLSIDRAEGDLSAELAGSGDLRIAQLRGPSADFAIAGSGNISAAGAVGKLKMSIAGSGDIDAHALTATSADVSIMGSGNASAMVDGDADVSIMGSGDAVLGPKAHCKTSKMGSGSVRCS